MRHSVVGKTCLVGMGVSLSCLVPDQLQSNPPEMIIPLSFLRIVNVGEDLQCPHILQAAHVERSCPGQAIWRGIPDRRESDRVLEFEYCLGLVSSPAEVGFSLKDLKL